MNNDVKHNRRKGEGGGGRGEGFGFDFKTFSVQIKRTPGGPPLTFSGKGEGGPPGVLFI